MKPKFKSKLFSRYLPLALAVLGLVVAGSTYLTLHKTTPVAEADWYSTGGTWLYRKAITIDHTKVSNVATSTYSNFPMLFSVTDIDLKFTGSGGKVASSTGADILFTASDGTTLLNYEIESYASTTGATVAWVKIPTLHAAYDDIIYIYFGNASAPANTASNIQNTWDTNYKGVWHLKETDIDGGSGDVKDSTSNANNGTTAGMDTADQVAGKVDGSFDFDGADSIAASNSASLTIIGDFTGSVWVFKDVASNLDYFFDYSNIGETEAVNYAYRFSVGATNYLNLEWENAAGNNNIVTSSQTVSAPSGQWALYSATRDVASNTVIFYENGVQLGTSQSYTNDPTGATSSVLVVGENYSGAGYFDGKLDEIQISNSVRSADWIKTEYNNQSSPSTFYSYGGLQSQSSSPGWYSTGGTWLYRKQITIDHTKVADADASGGESNFPMLFSVTDSDLKFTGSGGKVASSTGADILFTASDGTTLLNYEIEKYASTTGETVAWVKIPTLHAAYDDIIYIYFGNASAPANTASNIQNTWDTNFKGVWHLPNGTTLTAFDSTGVNNGALSATPPTATAGKVDGAGNFNGTNNYINVGHDSSLKVAFPFSVSAWINLGQTGAYQIIMNNDNESGNYKGFWFQVQADNTVSCNVGNNTATDSSGRKSYYTSSTLSLSTWYHVSCAFTNISTASLYLNGAANNGTSNGTATTMVTSADDAKLGVGSTGLTSIFKGIIDEVHLSNSARSADWIATEYNNQNSPSTFYTYGALGVQTRSGAGVKASSQSSSLGWYATGGTWNYRKAITIDHTKVSNVATTTYSNFPMLFSVTDADLKFTDSGGKVASSTGADILFTDSNGTTLLNYEIEKYASTTGETVAWVKIPTLHATYDDTIYVYFGNASAPANTASNIQNTWDANYKGVWHMGENAASATVVDSTSNTNTGTAAANTNAKTTAGRAGSGLTFNGSSDYIYTTTQFNNPQTQTLQAWVKTSTASGMKIIGFENAQSGTGGSSYDRQIWMGTDGTLRGAFYPANYPAGISSGAGYANNSWHQVVLTLDGSQNAKFFVDGAQVGSTVSGVTAQSYTGYYRIGSYKLSSWGAASDGYFTGTIDEARISTAARSADWIRTEYNNQSSPATFYAYGALGASTRQNSSGVSTPAVKVRGGVRFR